jgi:hypothetical protein
MDRVAKAKEILQTCRESAITIDVRPVLKPAGRVTPELEKAAREVVDELLELVLTERRDGASDPILCTRCNRVMNTTPAEEVAEVRTTLTMAGTGAAWPSEAVDRLEARMRTGDGIVRIDPPGYQVVIERADGSVYTVGRYDA